MDSSRSIPRTGVSTDDTTAVASQDDLYRKAAKELGPAMARLAATYEVNAAHREDLLQDIHLALWRSFETFRGECALRTWVYRVAHNTAATHVLRHRRTLQHQWVTLEELENRPDEFDGERFVDGWAVFEKLGAIVQKLKPIDRDVLLLYLEGSDAAEIADVVGLSPNHVAQKIRRTKEVLKRYFVTGEDRAHT
jgi:RNA polymerase sigma-70 factor (ECF subfamily)